MLNTVRQVLGGLLAGVVAIAAPRADAIEILDGTKLRESGFDIIYNARDLDKSQVRGGAASGGIRRPRPLAVALNDVVAQTNAAGYALELLQGWAPQIAIRHYRHRA